MTPKIYSSEGLVLKRINYSDSDRIVTIFSRDYGKIVAVAKGIRKLSSKKRGGLEVFSKIKFGCSKGKGLDLLTEVELLDPFVSIRTSLPKSSVAYFYVETIDKLTREEENRIYYDYCLSSLENLQNQDNLKSMRRKFTTDSLVSLGFWPKGKEMLYPDKVLENVVERKLNSIRIGKKVIS